MLRGRRRAGGENGISGVGLYENGGRGKEIYWARTPLRARALASSTVGLARRGRVVLILRK